MEQIASQLGFVYEEFDQLDRANRYHDLEFFKKGYDGRAYNVITGEKFGNGVELFDYMYSTTSFFSKRSRKHTSVQYA